MKTDTAQRKRVQTLYLDGGKLRERRNAVPGLTQAGLAELAGVDQSRIAHWESGTEGCGIEIIVRLAAALTVASGENCRPEDLMHDEGTARYQTLIQALAGKAAA